VKSPGTPGADSEVAIRLPADAALHRGPEPLRPRLFSRRCGVDLRLTSAIEADDKTFRCQAESVALQEDPDGARRIRTADSLGAIALIKVFCSNQEWGKPS